MKEAQKNSETLKNKIAVLSNQYDEAQKKVDELTKAFNKSVKETGATSEESQKLAKELQNAEKEADDAKSTLNKYNDELEKTGKKSEDGHQKLKKFAEQLGKGLKVAAKVGVAALSAAATGIATVAKASVENFAEYEQLAGGAQKIFNEMDPSVFLNDAQNAFVSLGLSANQYLAVMNDVGATFAATMGDEAGYNAAKTGLQAIADYASGTGKNIDELSQKFTLITRSTSSYQSIADQFSGILPATSAQFLEQAQAAGLLSESYTKLTDVPIAEYQAAVSQMLEIGVKDLGLFGNTQAEAFNTLSGSLSMAKASWSNLLTGMSDNTADMDKLINNFVTSVGAVGKNLLPKVKTALESAGELVEEIFPEIMAMIPELIDETLPELLDSAISIIETLVEGLAENGEQLGQSAVDIITKLATGLIDNLPQVIDAGMQILLGIIQGLADNTPTLIDKVIALIPQIVSALTSPDSLGQIINSAIEIVGALIVGIGDAIPQLLTAALDIVLAICEYLLVPENIANLVVTMAEFVLEIGEALVAGVGGLLTSVFEFGAELISMFDDVKWSEIGTEIVNQIKEGITNAWSTFTTWVSRKVDSVVSSIKSAISNAFSSEESGIEDVGAAAPSAYQSAQNVAQQLTDIQASTSALAAHVSSNTMPHNVGSSMTGSVTVVQNIYAQEMTAAELMQEAKYRAQQAVVFGV